MVSAKSAIGKVKPNEEFERKLMARREREKLPKEQRLKRMQSQELKAFVQSESFREQRTMFRNLSSAKAGGDFSKPVALNRSKAMNLNKRAAKGGTTA